MNRNDQTRNVELTLEQLEWYVFRARQLRNEVIARGLKHAYTGLRDGSKWAVARLGSVFHLGAGKQVSAHRAC